MCGFGFGMLRREPKVWFNPKNGKVPAPAESTNVALAAREPSNLAHAQLLEQHGHMKFGARVQEVPSTIQ